MAILQTFPIKSGSGHTITDNSSPITDRDTLNLIDFDIADDSANQVTDINPHLLTTAELDEIVSGVPNGYGDMPVVIDERGTEYVIGKYIKSDGTIVPLYQKIIQVTVTSGSKQIDTGISNIDRVVRIDAYSYDGARVTHLPSCYADGTNAPNFNWYCGISYLTSSNKILLEAGSEFPSVNPKCNVILQYTKTT